MGSYLSGSWGYGIVLPSGDESDYPPSKWMLDNKYAWVDGEDNGEIYYAFNWYEAGGKLAEELNLVFEISYVHDYSHGSVLFAPEAYVHSYDGVERFDADVIGSIWVSPEGTKNLKEAADRLGIDFEPGWILVNSYG